MEDDKLPGSYIVLQMSALSDTFALSDEATTAQRSLHWSLFPCCTTEDHNRGRGYEPIAQQLQLTLFNFPHVKRLGYA